MMGVIDCLEVRPHMVEAIRIGRSHKRNGILQNSNLSLEVPDSCVSSFVRRSNSFASAQSEAMPGTTTSFANFLQISDVPDQVVQSVNIVRP